MSWAWSCLPSSCCSKVTELWLEAEAWRLAPSQWRHRRLSSCWDTELSPWTFERGERLQGPCQYCSAEWFDWGCSPLPLLLCTRFTELCLALKTDSSPLLFALLDWRVVELLQDQPSSAKRYVTFWQIWKQVIHSGRVQRGCCWGIVNRGCCEALRDFSICLCWCLG